MSLEPGREIDGYLVEGVIGDGAAAVVYRAGDLRTGMPVVLKVPHPSVLSVGELRRRFRREARVTARIDHPNIQRNLDDGRHRSTPYLVLSYVPGHNLRTELLERDGIATAAVVADWAAQLAAILAAVHDANVLHRDLKPENIIIDPAGALHLVDFGDAATLDHPGGRYHILSGIQGTAEYLSPEQILGHRLDARSDLYAVGVVLYEALAGRVPFVGKEVLGTLDAHLRDTAADLRSVRDDIPPSLAAIVHTLLRRRPHERPHDARALSELLARRPEELPPLAPDPPLHGNSSSAEAIALARLVTIVAISFIVVVAAVLLGSVLG